MQPNFVPPEHIEQDTNGQALQAKLSAVQKGYFEDAFASEFVLPGPRKEIIIHRGYWARYNIFKLLVERFLNSGPETEKQIISLGCGFDTLFFNLKIDEKYKNNKFTYFELDLPDVIQKKLKKINNSQKCHQFFPEVVKNDGKFVNTENYKLFSSDLTNHEEFQKLLVDYGVDFSKPTFVFAECVLTYIPAKDTQNILEYFRNNFEFVQIMDYQMVNPNDHFGQQMVKNFKAKGCPLQGIFQYPNIQAHKDRYAKLEYKNLEIYDMLTIYNKCCDQNERKRIERLELLDEFEEWIIIQQHYFISLATTYNKEESQQKYSKFIETVKLQYN